MEVVVLVWDGNDGRSGEVRVKAHIGASVNLGCLNRVGVRKEGRRGPRSTGRLRRLSGCLGRPKGFGSRIGEAECCQQELGSERDLIRAVTAVAGVLNPLGTRLEGGVHVNEETCIGTATKLRGAYRSPSIRGLNFEQGGGAIGRFPLRTDPFTSKDSEHAGLKKVDSVGLSLLKSKRNVPGGGGGGRSRSSMREGGEPDDQLGGGGGFTRSKSSQLETIPATNVILGDHTADKFIGKSLCKALAREREGVSVDNFTCMGVEVARDAGAVVGAQG